MTVFSSGIPCPHEHAVTTLGLLVSYLAEKELYTRGTSVLEEGSTLSPDIQKFYRMCGSMFIIILQRAENSLVAYYVPFSLYIFLVFVLNVLISSLGMLQNSN